MDLSDTGRIFELRRETQRLMREAEKQAASRSLSEEQSAAFDRLAIELYDVDSALYEAPFVRNDSEIRRLIAEIRAASAAAQKVRDQLGEVKNAVRKARETLQGASGRLTKARALLDETEALVGLLSAS